MSVSRALSLALAYFSAFMFSPLLLCPHTPIFHVDFKTGKSTDEKWNGVGWREPISSSLVKISPGSLERMLCVKEPAKWQNTVGGFIIIFSLLCMYNDCPHYKTQDDVHNYIPPDGTETGASILHYTWCVFENMVVFLYLFIWNERLTFKHDILQITLHTVRWHLLINVVYIMHMMYNMFVHFSSFWDIMNAVFFTERPKLFAVFAISSELCVILRASETWWWIKFESS